MNRFRFWILCTLVIIFIIGLWAAVFPAAPYLPTNAFREPVSAIHNGLNVLFTALAFGGVLITLIFQSDEAKIARRESLEKSIFELFQIFTSDEFQKVKDRAFLALLAAVKSKDYAEYLASRLFVVEQLQLPERAEAVLRELDEHKKDMDRAALIHADRADRLMLDNMLNFFALLAQRESTATVIRHCDFAYDWWRPVLWIIGQLQEDRYKNSAQIQKYCKNQLIVTTLRSLDKIYGHSPLQSPREVWEYIGDHPKLRDFNLDPGFGEMARLAP